MKKVKFTTGEKILVMIYVIAEFIRKHVIASVAVAVAAIAAIVICATVKAPQAKTPSSGAHDIIVLETSEETPTATPEVTSEAAPEATEAPVEESEWHKAMVTCYSNTEDNVFVGTQENPLIDGYTCASFLNGKFFDNYLPFGSIIEIKGYGRWEVKDTAGDATLKKRAAQIAADDEIDQWFDLFFLDMPLDEIDAFGEKILEYRVIEKAAEK